VQLTGDKGDMGFSPYISALGNWIAWDEQSQKAVDTHVRAQGRDGIDGEAVRRVLVDSLPDLPESVQEAIKHRGVFYMLQTASGYDVYALLETADGAFAWVNIGDSNTIATHALYGIVKLGTSGIVSGAPVGVNANGGLEVAEATTVTAGVVVKSRDITNKFDTDVPTVEAVRAYIDQYYYTGDVVQEKINAVTSSITNVSKELNDLIDEVGTNELNIEILQGSNQQLAAKLNTYPTKEDVDNAISSAYDGIEEEIKQKIFIEMSADEYAKVTDPMPNVLYLIPEQ
jgi:archaellum component FlaC